MEFAKCVLFSLNYGEIDSFNKKNDSEGIFSLISDAADKLIVAGADCILLCANTMHQYASQLERKIDALIHIAQATGKAIKSRGLSKLDCLAPNKQWKWNFTS